MIKNSELKILLVDSSKIDKSFMFKTCDLNLIDVLICDKELPPQYQEAFTKAGIKLIVA